MGLINAGTLTQALDANGSPVPFATCHIYHEGTEQLATLFEDPALTFKMANPLRADADGFFNLCYALSGKYVLEFHRPRGGVLRSVISHTVQAPFSASKVNEFASLDDLLADGVMGYAGSGRRVSVLPGELLRVATGGFTYKVAPQDVNFAHFTTAGGIHIVVQPDTNGRYNALSFGADPTGVEDSRDAIQKCIDASYLGKQLDDAPAGTAYLPSGYYRITDTLHVGYGLNKGGGDTLGQSFQSIILEGDGEANNGNDFVRGTTIYADFSDRPAINLQGGRTSILRGMTMVGRLLDWIKDNDLGQDDASINTLDPASWHDPALAASGDSRYAPYAGVTIDAFTGSRPSEGYPAVNYPAYLGTVVQYDKMASSRVTLENLEITGFNTAIAQQPCDADANADFSGFHRIRIKRNKYGLSIGNSQSRTITGSQLIFAELFCAFTNNTHGRQVGTLGGIINGCAFDSIINLIQFTGTAQPGGIGPTKFQGFHGENIWRLGDISGGAGPNDTRVVFEQGNLNFGLQGAELGVPLSILGAGAGQTLGGSASIEFLGVQFQGYPSHLMFDCDPEALLFQSCQFGPKITPSEPWQWASHNATLGGVLLHNAGNKGVGNENKRARFIDCRVRSYDLSTGGSTKFKVGPRDYRSRSYCVSPYCDTIGPRDYRLTVDLLDAAATHITESDLLTSTLANGLWTLTFDGRDETTFLQIGPLPGDVMIDRISGHAFVVNSRTGDTVTAIAVTGVLGDGTQMPVNISGTGVAVPFDTANFQCFVLNSRYYAVQKPLWGEVSLNGTTIEAVGDDDGTSSDIETELIVGDALAVNRDEFRPFADAKAMINACSNAAATVTMSGGARYTRRIPLVQMIRQPVPNGS